MYQKEAHAFLSPSSTNFSMFMGGGKHAFFFILMLWTLGEM